MNRSINALLLLILVALAAFPQVSNISGNASTASALQNTPTLCPAGQSPTGILANGNATGCATTSPVPSRKGSVVVTNFSASTSAACGFAGLTQGNPSCSSAVYWPPAGYFRNFTMTTGNTNGQGLVVRAGISIDARLTNIPDAGGAIVTPGGAAGSYVDSNSADFYHTDAVGAPVFTWLKRGAATAAPMNALAAEFIDDGGLYASVLGGYPNGNSGSVTQYYPFMGVGVPQTNELIAGIPIPFAATVGSFSICIAGAPAANISPVMRKNGVSQTSTVTIASTDAAQGCYNDSTHSFTVTAGDYIDALFVPGGGSPYTAAGMYIVVTPTSGTSTMLAGLINGTVTTTPTFNLPGTSATGTTIASEELGLPIACTASNLYVVQAVANGAGVTTTFTLEKNGADTAVTGTITNGSGTGSKALDTTHSVSYAQGDLMTLKYVTGSGTSGTIGGWAIQCQ